ncbi:hypothetical protein E1B28_006318 [Marasmius oreades]|uniref:Uncharacterized protein n=1 Tax=Marasmius oreades TaxID=181124 RepID=A0A9P7S5G7_9AGAR|nr:uncharacterized protein E1B28_006318 [Marasmius oreades]KAG7095588.1 hypothetical protein E1B28_006318 [Marasmius oreades]
MSPCGSSQSQNKRRREPEWNEDALSMPGQPSLKRGKKSRDGASEDINTDKLEILYLLATVKGFRNADNRKKEEIKVLKQKILVLTEELDSKMEMIENNTDSSFNADSSSPSSAIESSSQTPPTRLESSQKTQPFLVLRPRGSHGP